MKNIIKYMPLVAVAFLMAACQSDDEQNFSNKAYIDATTMTSETIIKGATDIVKTLDISSARPAEKEIAATFSVAPSLVDTYNKAYYDSAKLLPDSCYQILEGKVTINKGSVKSSDASFRFYKLSKLSRNDTFVLPVTVQSDDIPLLASAATYYYVFRAGALINVVADIENNSLEVYPWATASRVNNMHQITMEALVYPREFGQLISTVMGIEGNFLMRIGDAGIPDNQIQIATSAGNFTDSKLQLETGKWSHVAVTYDVDAGSVIVYINGHAMASGKMTKGAIDISGNGTDRNFLIGKSYEDSRDLNGCIAEARVWDVIRTQEEIAGNIYTVDPASKGLVAYWKFDDESSFAVKDYTGNGNNLAAKKSLTWKAVSLPAAN